MGLDLGREDRQKPVTAHVFYDCEKCLAAGLTPLLYPSPRGPKIDAGHPGTVLCSIPTEPIPQVSADPVPERHFLGISALDLHVSPPP